LKSLKPRTTHVNAVHEEHTRALLEDLGVADDFDRGTLHCAICKDPLLKVGLGAARRRGDSFVFACARLECIKEVSWTKH
jgi:hypothetical protein